MVSNWYDVHVEALNCIDRDNGIKYFRKSKVPGAYSILTSVESNKLQNNN